MKYLDYMLNSPKGDWTLEEEEQFIADWGNDAFNDAAEDFFDDDYVEKEDDEEDYGYYHDDDYDN